MTRILITPRSLSKDGHPALAVLEQAGFTLVMPAPGMMPDEEVLMSALPGCVGWLAGVEPVSERVLDTAAALKVISRNGSGIDNLPLAALDRLGIKVHRAAGSNARSVAELSLSLLMAGFRQIVWTHEGLRTGAWPRKIGREIHGSTIGIIGLGAVGVQLAQMCLDLGANVKSYDPFAPADRLLHDRLERVGFDEAVCGVDAISLHMPLPDDGKPLFTRGLFAKVAPDTVLVNTARAGLVDESAVLAALDDGRLTCYATDVFDPEPPQLGPLLSHPKVILTSHIGGFTTGAVDRVTRESVENLLLGLDGYAD